MRLHRALDSGVRVTALPRQVLLRVREIVLIERQLRVGDIQLVDGV